MCVYVLNQFFCPLSCFPTIQYKSYWLVKLNSLFLFIYLFLIVG